MTRAEELLEAEIAGVIREMEASGVMACSPEIVLRAAAVRAIHKALSRPPEFDRWTRDGDRDLNT